MSNILFNVYERDLNENKKRLRKNGDIPGVICGKSLGKSIPVKMKEPELKKMLKENNSGSIIEVDFQGKKLNCVVKDVQKDVFNNILHVDFQHTKPNEAIKMKIPVQFTGQENLVSKRLIWDTSNTSVEFHGPVEKIPEFIELDVSQLKFDDKLYIRDIAVPEGISILYNPDTMLGIVSALK